jgi:hypothetical protein
LHAVHDAAGVRFIDNGWRKSAFSYWLAAHKDTGIGQVASWGGNSEASCRQFYLAALTPLDGLAWFEATG